MKHTSPHISRRRFLGGAAMFAGSLKAARAANAAPRTTATEATPSPYTLHFAQPASKWPNALPVGNGRLGAVVFGGVGVERIQLNEESIWDGEPNRDRNNPKAAAAIPRIREMLFAGQIAEAEALAVSDVLSVPRRMPCYQTLGDLHLDFGPSDKDGWPTGVPENAAIEDYRLQLDLDTAIVTTTFIRAGIQYRREVFSSAPDQVIVVRMSASQPFAIGFRATLDRPPGAGNTIMSDNKLSLYFGSQAWPVNDNPGLPDKEHRTGVSFWAEIQLIAEGMKANYPAVDPSNYSIGVYNADAVTLLIDCATSYRYPAHASIAKGSYPSGIDADVLIGDLPNMRAAVDRNLTAASHRSYAELRARHIADHQRYFRRASIDFGPDPNAATSTDRRIAAIKAGGEDIHLLPIYFQFGRYMLISSSRPGTLAANLQGIWNDSVDPPWGSKYTVNINTEMNYWLAERANLSECHLPLFDLLATTLPQGRVTAQEIYRAKGSVVHHNTDIWGDSGPIDGLGGGVWPMGACWLSLHLWDHYAYTGDRRFLAERAYPALRENAVFLLDYMVRDPHTGHLTTGPSCSPENAYQLPNGKSYNLCMGPTMDIEIVRAVLSRLLQTAALLENSKPGSIGPATADAEFLDRARTAITRLPPFQIAHDGRLQEWQQDYTDHEPGHRHISHLFALYPEDQITVQGTPELARAARVTLDKRLAAGGGSTGWSRSWIINCMARLGDGEACYANILELLRQSTRQNLFDVCGLKENSPFQIDGNLGGPSGLIEMLLQSHGETPLIPPADAATWSNDSTTPVIRLLPALPHAWPNGSFRGLRAQGGVEVSLRWQNGAATTASLRSTLEGEVRIVLPPQQREASLVIDGRTTRHRADGMVTLRTRPGVEHKLVFSTAKSESDKVRAAAIP